MKNAKNGIKNVLSECLTDKYKKIVLIGDDRLKYYNILKDLIDNLKDDRFKSDEIIKIYDGKGKIIFNYGNIYNVRKDIVNSFWETLGLDDLTEKDKMLKIKEALDDLDLVDDMNEALEGVLDIDDVEKYSDNLYFKKWCDKLSKRIDGKYHFSKELVKKYDDNKKIVSDEIFISELPESSKDTIYMIVSNKIIIYDLWFDILSLIYENNEKERDNYLLLIFESTKDRLSILEMLKMSKTEHESIKLRETKKYQDYLIKI